MTVTPAKTTSVATIHSTQRDFRLTVMSRLRRTIQRPHPTRHSRPSPPLVRSNRRPPSTREVTVSTSQVAILGAVRTAGLTGRAGSGTIGAGLTGERESCRRGFPQGGQAMTPGEVLSHPPRILTP